MNAQSVKFLKNTKKTSCRSTRWQRHFRNILQWIQNFKGRTLLYSINHATGLSVSNFVKSKEPEVILKAIFKSWIQIYGALEKFLTDNSGEFANSKFLDMAEAVNIIVKVTATEPSSDRHDFIIADMMGKVFEESQHLDINLTLAWCLNAKNSLENVHGFSPFQFVFGQKTQLPSTFANKTPAVIQHTSKILTDNLTTLHKAIEAFISSESPKHKEPEIRM